MSLLAAITGDDNACFTITFFINPYYLWNVSPVRYVLFSHDKTVFTLQKYYFSFISCNFRMEKFSKSLNFP